MPACDAAVISGNAHRLAKTQQVTRESAFAEFPFIMQLLKGRGLDGGDGNVLLRF